MHNDQLINEGANIVLINIRYLWHCANMHWKCLPFLKVTGALSVFDRIAETGRNVSGHFPLRWLIVRSTRDHGQ